MIHNIPKGFQWSQCVDQADQCGHDPKIVNGKSCVDGWVRCTRWSFLRHSKRAGIELDATICWLAVRRRFHRRFLPLRPTRKRAVPLTFFHRPLMANGVQLCIPCLSTRRSFAQNRGYLWFRECLGWSMMSICGSRMQLYPHPLLRLLL